MSIESLFGEPLANWRSLGIDTGASQPMNLDARVAQAYYDQIPGSKSSTAKDGTITWTMPCSSIGPDLELHIGNGTAIYPWTLLEGDSVDNGANAGSE